MRDFTKISTGKKPNKTTAPKPTPIDKLAIKVARGKV